MRVSGGEGRRGENGSTAIRVSCAPRVGTGLARWEAGFCQPLLPVVTVAAISVVECALVVVGVCSGADCRGGDAGEVDRMCARVRAARGAPSGGR